VTARPTVLVMRALGLGDTITGLPALRLLRTRLPDAHVVLAIPRVWGELVVRAGLVDDIVDSSELAPLTAAPREPALAIDLHGNGVPSLALLQPLRPRRIISYAGGDAAWRHDEHEVARWCRLLREALPAPDAKCGTVAGALGEPPRTRMPAGRTVVHVGAKSASRRWPADRFAAVAADLARAGHDVLVSGGPGEETLAAQVADASGAGCETAMTLDELLGLIGTARLLVSGDTGVAHVAAAYRTPTVTLFGPVSPARWGPPADPRHQVLWHGDDTGDPHGDVPDPALLRIDVDEVLAAAGRALADSAPTEKEVTIR
jgi:ADP-heptose:LPS heptosyltransferase